MNRVKHLWLTRDTWGERLSEYLVCSWRGHRWKPKMHGRICDRCRLFEYMNGEER